MSDYTILLIDYDPRSIEHIRGLLSAAGHRVEVAKNGIAGLESFREHEPSLVLVEAMLPKKHGFEVCQEIKASPAGKSVPVILITAVYRGRKYRSQAFHIYKCDEYLEKPIADDKLVEVVNGFLQRAPGGASATGTPKRTEPVAATSEPVRAKSKDAQTAPDVQEEKVERAGGNGDTQERKAEKPVASADGSSEEELAEFTEDDIMSTLDAIMPDDNSAKTASG